MWKMANNTHIEEGTNELDKYLPTKITTENDLEQQVDLFSEAVQSPCWRTFQILPQGRRTIKNLYLGGQTASIYCGNE